MALSFSLPYDPHAIADPITWRLTEMALIEDWNGSLLFKKLVRLGRLKTDEHVAHMRRFLHVNTVLETELRMRYKDRGYYGL